MIRSISLGLVLALLAVANAMPARAQSITDGQSLMERCRVLQFVNPSAGLHCRGYIGAVADILSAGNQIDEWRACPPNLRKRDALTQDVRAWLKVHPQDLEVEAFRLVARALSETYPCGD